MVIFWGLFSDMFSGPRWLPGWSLSIIPCLDSPGVRLMDLYGMETHRFSSLIWLICLRFQKERSNSKLQPVQAVRGSSCSSYFRINPSGLFWASCQVCRKTEKTSWDECSVSIWFSYCHPWSHEKTHRKTFRMEKWSGNQDWLALAVRPLALMILAVLLCFPSSDTDIQHRSPVRPIG